MALESGTRLGSYEISDLLGKGGMGEVYRARDTKLGREVAIKVLPDEFSRDEERLARLEREARMLAALNHPNLAAIHGLEEADDTRFLVLELVEGDTLADRLKRGAIPVEESLKLALQIAEALEAAHEKGVIHRDLKPANIKVTPEGRVKVLDFGLAKAFIGDQADVNLSNSPTLSMQATQQGLILGTAGYMSPEQARGGTADHRADVWAFGVVLFEMLTGRTTFDGNTVSDILASVLKTDPAWQSLPPNLHPRLRLLLERCLEKDLKRRYHNISDARVDIESVLAERDGGVVPQSVAASRGQGLRWAWGAVPVVAVLSVLGGWMLAPNSPGETHGVVRVPFVLPDGQALSNLGQPAIDVSDDGRMIAYTANNQLYVKELDEEEPRLVQGSDVPARRPTISPDGLSIAYLTNPGTGPALRRIPVTGGAPVTLWEGPAAPSGPEWNWDNTIFLSLTEGIIQLAGTGGEPTLVVEAASDERLAAPRLLPNGDVLFTAGAADVGQDTDWDTARIFVQSIGEDDRTLIWEGGGDAQYLRTGHLVYAQGDALFALPLDLDRRVATSGPTSVVDSILRSASGASPTGQYAISDNGTFVQIEPFGITANSPTTLAYADRSGDLEEIDLPPGVYGHARVSPDGTRIVFEVTDADGSTDLWVYDRDGRSQPVQLTRGGNNSRPIWSRDSEYVAFTSTRDGTPSIWWQRADLRAEAEKLTDSDGAQHWADAWSPDGETLLYTRFAGNLDQTIWTLTMGDGAEPVQFTETENLAGGATFSPSGDWIAYRALVDPGVAASGQIFVKPFPLSGPEIQVSLNGGSHPIFSSNGRELFYRRSSPTVGGPAQNEFVGIDISTEGRVTYGVEQVIPIEGLPARFGIRDYDVIPGEERFLVMVPAGATGRTEAPDQEIKIILNWFQELRERVPVS